jgi:primosomal protein N' (replication factor Y)
VATVVRDRPHEKFIAVGYGSQKAEAALQRQLPAARIVRLDSDAIADQSLLPRTLEAFRAGEIDILVGTQILAKGHDFPNVTLIVILEVDQLLGLPDFRAGERAFQLLVQAAGRAGRAQLPGRVLMQTIRPDHPIINAAMTQDYAAFVSQELAFRRAHAYPPYSRMIAFELNSPYEARLGALAGRIEAWIEKLAAEQPSLVQPVRILGPASPPIETIRGRHRRQLIFSSPQIASLRGLASRFAAAFEELPHDVRLRIDVDPQSLI